MKRNIILSKSVFPSARVRWRILDPTRLPLRGTSGQVGERESRKILVLDLIGERGYGFLLEFIPWIPAFAGMTHGAGMTKLWTV